MPGLSVGEGALKAARVLFTLHNFGGKGRISIHERAAFKAPTTHPRPPPPLRIIDAHLDIQTSRREYHMDKTTFINSLIETRAQWDALISQIDEQWMLEPGVEGHWSIKDIIAHNMWNELEMIPLIQTRSLTGSELWNLPQDERNEAVYLLYRDTPLQTIIAQEREAYTQLLKEAQTLNDEDLNDPHRFKNMPDTEGWIPWRIIAGCSFTHYPGHMASIREWLTRGGGGG